MDHRTCLTAAIAAGALLAGCAHTSATGTAMAEAARQAQREINRATIAVERMQSEARTATLLSSAQGVLVIPDYGKGAYFLGGQGGRGVLLLRESGRGWSQPAFYSIGGASFALQAGGETGPVALLLMTYRAVEEFESNASTWQLGADTGLTVVNSSGLQAVLSATPKADIVMWSGVKGLYGGISAEATYITPDGGLDDAYYHRLLTNRQILTSAVADRHTANLREALASGGSGSAYR